MKSLKKNVLYNSIYQFLILFLPFITAPYLARVIGATGVGVYSYSYSVAQYFVYFAMLGLNNYGNRSIAAVNNDREKRSKVFSEIYCMQLITSVGSVILYTVYIMLSKNKVAALIMMLYVFSAAFDINWLFFGTENFKLTVTRNIIIKIGCLVAIFLFVKDAGDTYIYVLIMALSTFISQVALWPFVKREVEFKFPKFNDIIKHFKPNLLLFIPVVAVSIYRVMDKIMLGSLASTEALGYYEYANKIYEIPLLLVTAVGTVMLPRMTYLYSNDKLNEATKYLDETMEYVLAFANAATMGLIAIADEFVLLYYGKAFTQSGDIIKYLCVTIVFVAAGNVLRTQYLIPKKRDAVYSVSAVLGAIVNFVINAMLIPSMGAIGAALGTIAAEFVVFAYQAFCVRKEMKWSKYILMGGQYLILAVVMWFIITRITLSSILLTLMIRIALGVIIYGIGFVVIFYMRNKKNPVKQLLRLKK